jgi:hypothetical protein
MENSQDLSKFGYRELSIAGKLLTQYAENPDIIGLGDGVVVECNFNSGNVFLVDEDYNVAMLNGDTIEPWYYCPICGHEGFLEDMEHNEDREECQEYLKELKGVK